MMLRHLHQCMGQKQDRPHIKLTYRGPKLSVPKLLKEFTPS